MRAAVFAERGYTRPRERMGCAASILQSTAPAQNIPGSPQADASLLRSREMVAREGGLDALVDACQTALKRDRDKCVRNITPARPLLVLASLCASVANEHGCASLTQRRASRDPGATYGDVARQGRRGASIQAVRGGKGNAPLRLRLVPSRLLRASSAAQPLLTALLRAWVPAAGVTTQTGRGFTGRHSRRCGRMPAVKLPRPRPCSIPDAHI